MKIDKSKLMKKAWEIARNAVKNFGGKIIEYISESMKTAWREMKKSTENVFYVLKMIGYAADARDFDCIPDRWEISLTESTVDPGDSHEEYDNRFVTIEVYEEKSEALETIEEIRENHTNVALI